jgi:hypothetical protein
LILIWLCKKKKKEEYYLELLFFLSCRVIDAFIEADRKGYEIRVSNDNAYEKQPDTV